MTKIDHYQIIICKNVFFKIKLKNGKYKIKTCNYLSFQIAPFFVKDISKAEKQDKIDS